METMKSEAFSRSKATSFRQEEQDLAHFAKALSHPARIRILLTLAKRKSCVCGDLVLDSPLAQATISQHLRELRNAGLVQGDISGPRVCYCLNPDSIKQLKKLFTEFGEELNSPGIKECC